MPCCCIENLLVAPLSASDIRVQGSPTSTRMVRETAFTAAHRHSTTSSPYSQSLSEGTFPSPQLEDPATPDLTANRPRLATASAINSKSNNSVINENSASEADSDTTVDTVPQARLPFLASRSTPSLIPSSPRRSSLIMRSSRRIPVPASPVDELDFLQPQLQPTSTQTASPFQLSNAFTAPPTRLEEYDSQEHTSPQVWMASKPASLDHALASFKLSDAPNNTTSTSPYSNNTPAYRYSRQYSLDCACQPEPIPERRQSMASERQSPSNSSVDSIFDSPFPSFPRYSPVSPSESMTRSWPSQQESSVGTSVTSQRAGENNLKTKKSFFRWRTLSTSQFGEVGGSRISTLSARLTCSRIAECHSKHSENQESAFQYLSASQRSRSRGRCGLQSCRWPRQRTQIR